LSSGRADTPQEGQANWDKRIAAIRSGGLANIADGVMAVWFSEKWRLGNAATVDEFRTMLTGSNPAGYIACCEAIKTVNYLPRLGEITNETLFMVGSEDQGAPAPVVRDMAERTPGAQFAQIEGAAHIPNVEATAAFNGHIASFLGIE